MQIQQISVTGLFEIFDHVIPLNMDERITIIHGPNGFGKTAMLKMLNGFFNSRYSVFRTIPFKNFRVEFDNASSVEVVKASKISDKTSNKNYITFNFYEPNSEKVTFPLEEIKNLPDIDLPIELVEDIVPELRRVGSKNWRYLPTGEILSLNEVINRFEDVLALKVKLREEPEWLEDLKNNIHVRLNRITTFVKLRPQSFF
jgi:AAA15 family ATPase/GTPase